MLAWRARSGVAADEHDGEQDDRRQATRVHNYNEKRISNCTDPVPGNDYHTEPSTTRNARAAIRLPAASNGRLVALTGSLRSVKFIIVFRNRDRRRVGSGEYLDAQLKLAARSEVDVPRDGEIEVLVPKERSRPQVQHTPSQWVRSAGMTRINQKTIFNVNGDATPGDRRPSRGLLTWQNTCRWPRSASTAPDACWFARSCR